MSNFAVHDPSLRPLWAAIEPVVKRACRRPDDVVTYKELAVACGVDLEKFRAEILPHMRSRIRRAIRRSAGRHAVIAVPGHGYRVGNESDVVLDAPRRGKRISTQVRHGMAEILTTPTDALSIVQRSVLDRRHRLFSDLARDVRVERACEATLILGAVTDSHPCRAHG